MLRMIITIEMIRMIIKDDVPGGSYKGAIQHQPVPIPTYAQLGVLKYKYKYKYNEKEGDLDTTQG